MSENNKIINYINEYFDKKTKSTFDTGELFRLVEEAMDASSEEIVAVPAEEVEEVEAELEAEIEAVRKFEDGKLDATLDKLHKFFGGVPAKKWDTSNADGESQGDTPSVDDVDHPTPEDQVEEAKTKKDKSNRGGMQAQESLAKWLNGTLANKDLVAVTNKGGSNTPDVIVFDLSDLNSEDYEKLRFSSREGYELKYEPVVYADIPTGAIIARFEVKASNSFKILTSTEKKVNPHAGNWGVNVAFFDQTIGIGQLGKGNIEEKYFGEALKELAKIQKLHFKVGEEWQTAEKFFDDFKGKNEEVFNIILNQGHFLAGKPKEGEEQEYNRCGNYGELIAPKDLSLYRHMAGYHGFESFKGVYCNMHLADAGDYKPPKDPKALKKHFQYYFYNEGGPKPKKDTSIKSVSDDDGPPKVENVFFYQKIENTEGKTIPYFYKMTVKKSFEIEFEDGSPSRMGYITNEPVKRRAAANTGTMLARCFKFEVPFATGEGDTDEVKAEVTASRGVAEKILTGVKTHWTHGDHGDDYFVVVGRHGAKGDYQKMLVYKTASKDPLNFGVEEFNVDDMANTYFATYGSADSGQVRAKVGANMVAPPESLIDISNIEVNEEVSKGIAASDLFKMIEEAISDIKTQTKKHK